MERAEAAASEQQQQQSSSEAHGQDTSWEPDGSPSLPTPGRTALQPADGAFSTDSDPLANWSQGLEDTPESLALSGLLDSWAFAAPQPQAAASSPTVKRPVVRSVYSAASGLGRSAVPPAVPPDVPPGVPPPARRPRSGSAFDSTGLRQWAQEPDTGPSDMGQYSRRSTSSTVKAQENGLSRSTAVKEAEEEEEWEEALYEEDSREGLARPADDSVPRWNLDGTPVSRVEVNPVDGRPLVVAEAASSASTLLRADAQRMYTSNWLPDGVVGPVELAAARGRGWTVVTTDAIRKGDLLMISEPWVMVTADAPGGPAPRTRTLLRVAALKQQQQQQQDTYNGGVAGPGAPEFEQSLALLWHGDSDTWRRGQPPPVPLDELVGQRDTPELAGWRAAQRRQRSSSGSSSRSGSSSGSGDAEEPVGHRDVPELAAWRAVQGRQRGRSSGGGGRSSSRLEYEEEEGALDLEHLQRVIELNAFGDVRADAATTACRGEAARGFLGLWPAFSMVNHSCVPSASHLVVGDRMIIRANQNSAEGTEVTVNYLGRTALSPRAVRQAELQERYGFECQCARCAIEGQVVDAQQLGEVDMPAVLNSIEQLSDAASDALSGTNLSLLAELHAAADGLEGALGHLFDQVLLPPTERVVMEAAIYDLYEVLQITAEALAIAGDLAPPYAGWQPQPVVDTRPSLLQSLVGQRKSRSRQPEGGGGAAAASPESSPASSSAVVADVASPQRRPRSGRDVMMVGQRLGGRDHVVAASSNISGKSAAAAAQQQQQQKKHYYVPPAARADQPRTAAFADDEEGDEYEDDDEEEGQRGPTRRPRRQRDGQVVGQHAEIEEAAAAAAEAAGWQDARRRAIKTWEDAACDAARRCLEVVSSVLPGCELHTLGAARLYSRMLDRPRDRDRRRGSMRLCLDAHLTRYGPLDAATQQALVSASARCAQEDGGMW